MKNQPVDICIVTYNRLEYLKNCVWSIIASTKINYRLIVISDNSTDGTNEWLNEMKSHGKIDEIIINEENLGSTKTFNKVINASTSEFFVMLNDDMWFHRGWDEACVRLFNENKDCGIVTFFNYPIDHRIEKRRHNKYSYKWPETGLAASMIRKRLFNSTRGFRLPEGVKMGYFARVFCKEVAGLKDLQNKQYITDPYYAEQMDRFNPGVPGRPKLHQEYLYGEYNKRRGIEKTKHKDILAGKRK